MSEELGQLVIDLIALVINDTSYLSWIFYDIMDSVLWFMRSLAICICSLAEYCENLLYSFNSYLGQYYYLKVALIYLVFFVFMSSFAGKNKRKVAVVYTSKVLDKDSQETVKSKVAEKVQELKSLIDKLNSPPEQSKSGDFSKKIDKALIELKKVQNLHCEYKDSVINSHNRVIELLGGKLEIVNKAEKNDAEWERTDFLENARENEVIQTKVEIEAKISESRLAKTENKAKILENLPKKIESKPNIFEKNETKMKSDTIDNKDINELIAQEVPEENKHAEDKTRKNSENLEKDLSPKLENSEKDQEPTQPKQEELKREEEIMRKPVPFKPAVFTPRPAPINISRQPPAPRGKIVPPAPSERSKYVPPPIIKSSPFG